MPKILLATLGTSPAVITTAVDLLKAEGVVLKGVVLLGTTDYDVRAASDLLANHLPVHDGIGWVEPLVPGDEFSDVDDANAAIRFLTIACQRMKSLRDNGDEVYVCISGGRKSMAALLALAAQFYGAHRLFHVWVPPYIEEEGEVLALQRIEAHPEEFNRRLHPLSRPLQDYDRPRLVDLPFVGLVSLLPQVLEGLRSPQSVDREIRKMLEGSGLVAGGEVTARGETVRRILDDVEATPPPRPGSHKVHVADHHYKGKLQDYAQRLGERFPFILGIRSLPWDNGPDRVDAVPPNRLTVRVRLREGPRLALQLETTAASAGQLEAARRMVEEFVRER